MGERAVLKQAAPQFVVPDVVHTAEYYRDILGFKILGYFAEPPVFAMVARDGVEIHFGKADGEILVNETQRRGVGCDAYIFVDDVHALYDEFTASGADIIEGPIRRAYNCVEITVKDRNGYLLVFGE